MIMTTTTTYDEFVVGDGVGREPDEVFGCEGQRALELRGNEETYASNQLELSPSDAQRGHG